MDSTRPTVVVAESLARAFAIVGAAGLVRYRARVKDTKDAGMMLVALALGLTVGSGLYGFAVVALQQKGVTYELLGSSSHELHYEVTVPFDQKIGKLTKVIRGLDARHGTSVEWDIKKYRMLKP